MISRPDVSIGLITLLSLGAACGDENAAVVTLDGVELCESPDACELLTAECALDADADTVFRVGDEREILATLSNSEDGDVTLRSGPGLVFVLSDSGETSTRFPAIGKEVHVRVRAIRSGVSWIGSSHPRDSYGPPQDRRYIAVSPFDVAVSAEWTTFGDKARVQLSTSLPTGSPIEVSGIEEEAVSLETAGDDQGSTASFLVDENNVPTDFRVTVRSESISGDPVYCSAVAPQDSLELFVEQLSTRWAPLDPEVPMDGGTRLREGVLSARLSVCDPTTECTAGDAPGALPLRNAVVQVSVPSVPLGMASVVDGRRTAEDGSVDVALKLDPSVEAATVRFRIGARLSASLPIVPPAS